MSDELVKAATNAAATIDSIYQWLDRVKAAGGTTCVSGIATTHAMLTSLEKNRPRVETLVMEPLRTALEEYLK